MPNSMTGYGRFISTYDGMEISFEIKSVNNRFLDTNIRVPRSASQFEDKIKKLISDRVSRGKIDAFLNINRSEGSVSRIILDEDLLLQYVKSLNRINELCGFSKPLELSSVTRFGDIFTKETVDEDEEELWRRISETCEKAIESFTEMRAAEGRNLYADLTNKLDELENVVKDIDRLSPDAVNAYRERLISKINEILGNESFDEQRVLTEVAIVSDKLATDEERTRLYSHISQFRNLLTLDEPIGKKLDFLVQEMNREVNTIGSKCQMLEISKLVIEAKCTIEKIREQIQNIE
ncbi:MAG: YicC family protein [Firmicutes bacterium]|nr:YicC family protein [Bacillota bacterium]